MVGIAVCSSRLVLHVHVALLRCAVWTREPDRLVASKRLRAHEELAEGIELVRSLKSLREEICDVGVCWNVPYSQRAVLNVVPDLEPPYFQVLGSLRGFGVVRSKDRLKEKA